MSAAIGATNLAEMLERVESTFKGDGGEITPEALAECEREFERVIVEINVYTTEEALV